MNHTIIAAAAAITTVSLACNHKPVAESCCTVYPKTGFKGRGRDYCIDNTKRQSAYTSKKEKTRMPDEFGSVKCGTKVDAIICPNGFTMTQGTEEKDALYICEDQAQGVKVEANQEDEYVLYDKKTSSIIIDHHPWVTKGKDYISLTRQEKHSIIWDKITESEEMGGNFHNEVTEIDASQVFDERGDEFDCRHKSLHSTGNVGKVFWVDEGGHNYTGLFKGGDSGYVRLTSTNVVVGPLETAQPPFSNVPGKMMPAMALKFLRDGEDSGNTFGVLDLEGQASYNFFESSLTTKFGGSSNEDWTPIGINFKTATDFVTSIGNSDFASIDQDGIHEETPVFPFDLRFEPAAGDHLQFPPDTYFEPLEEYLQKIKHGEELYKVFALDKPLVLGGTEQLIGKIVLASTLVTSFWGDQHMYFRHQKFDDDLVIHPEWKPEVFAVLFPGETEGTIRPSEGQFASYCPFSFLFQ